MACAKSCDVCQWIEGLVTQCLIKTTNYTSKITIHEKNLILFNQSNWLDVIPKKKTSWWPHITISLRGWVWNLCVPTLLQLQQIFYTSSYIDQVLVSKLTIVTNCGVHYMKLTTLCSNIWIPPRIIHKEMGRHNQLTKSLVHN